MALYETFHSPTTRTEYLWLLWMNTAISSSMKSLDLPLTLFCKLILTELHLPVTVTGWFGVPISQKILEAQVSFNFYFFTIFQFFKFNLLLIQDSSDADDHSLMLAAAHDCSVEIWHVGHVSGVVTYPSVTTGATQITLFDEAVVDMVFSPDSTAIAVASLDGYVRFFLVIYLLLIRMFSPKCNS